MSFEIEKEKCFLGILILALIVAGGCSSSPPTKTPVSQPTNTSKPIVSSEPSQTPITIVETSTQPDPTQPGPEDPRIEQFYLPVEIVWGSGAGVGPFCLPKYRSSESNISELPTIKLFHHEGIYKDNVRNSQGFAVCLFNMPIETPLFINFSNSAQNITVRGMVEVVPKIYETWRANVLTWHTPENVTAGFSTVINNKAIIEFHLWWPQDLPSGDWLIKVVNKDTLELISSANYQILQDNSPWIEAVSQGTDLYTLHPSSYPWLQHFCRFLSSFESGDSITINGSGLPSNTNLNLGIYESYHGDHIGNLRQLMSEIPISTNSNGEFTYLFPQELLIPGRKYYVYAIWDPNFEITGQGLVTFGGTDTCFKIP